MKKRLLFILTCAILACTQGLLAQNIVGKVVDKTGTSIPGASVLTDGGKKGSYTEADGTFTIAVTPGTYTVKCSFIGYEDVVQNVTVTDSDVTVNFTLKESSILVDEAIVVGYGVQRKREVVGAITKVDAKSITGMPSPSFEATLQGQAAGVQVIQSSGIAGAGSIVRIRGVSSLSAGGDPLYVVDGIPITQDPFLGGERGGQNTNPLATINPNDIASIEILKDASAVGIYGSRGSNGVILITTKRAKISTEKQKPQFNFSSRWGTSTPTKKLDMLNSAQWLQLHQEAWENDDNTGLAPLPGGVSYEDARNTDTDWWDVLTQRGFKESYNLGVKWGSQKLALYAGGGYSDQQSYLLGNSYERLSGRFNVDYRPFKTLSLSASSSLARGTNNRAFQAWDGGLGTAMSSALPIYPVYNEDGTYFREGNMRYGNPVARQELIDWFTTDDRSITNGSITWTPSDSWSINASGGLDLMNISDNQFEPNEWLIDSNNDEESYAKQWVTRVLNYNVFATATYKFKMPEHNNLRAMIGTEAQRSTSTGRYNQIRTASDHIVNGPEFDAFDTPDPSTANSNFSGSENPVDRWSFLSYFSRFNYDFKNKFYAQFTGRVDGSSRFGTNNRYGFFPTVGLSYVVTEDFLKDHKTINFIKLRTSWGLVGSAGIPNFSRWGLFDVNSVDTYNGQAIKFPSQLENPDLSWETTRTIDFGAEIGLFNDRLTINAGYYNKLTSDVLVNSALQSSSGFDRFFINVGEVENRGLEAGIVGRILTKKLKWTATANLSRNKNEVISIGTTTPDAIGGSGDTRVIPGLPVGVNYLVVMDHVDTETGLPVFLTPEGEETFEWSEGNRQPLGDVQPDLTGSIQNSFSYNSWELSFMWVFTLGGNIYDDSAKRQLGVVSDWNMRPDIFDRWTQPGDVAKYPKLTLDPTTYGGMGSFWFYNTDQWLYDATYLRLRNVTLGYNIPAEKLEKFGLGTCRLYVVGTNLFTFTEYPGADPEIVRDHNGPQARNISPNVTYLTPPQEKTFSFGIDITF